jgi:V/A-type H+-transporting ATPase subunit D
VPPGRAGRLWLHRRIATAARGRDQLDRKLRILLPEQQRLRIQADRARAAWEAAYAIAQTWLVRAALLGGEDALRHGATPGYVQLTIVETTSIGLRYPIGVELSGAAPQPDAPPDNSAVPAAAAAFRAAVLTGARAAAAAEAVRRLDREIGITRRRLRALDKRWLPWLQGTLAGLELALEQAEQDDGVRLRKAVAGTTDRRLTP